jgi:selenocysteine-specific elongation factor
LIGTAGHVDHGKSTLVMALTGRDPDRFEEEKRRGLTIDLGFAWANLPGGVEASFVDVPGHERFSKNMLAGIEAVDVALLVVAANEGWKPQSEEHLAVLDLLEVDKGVVALTKVDLTDRDTVELTRLEVEERLAATSLSGSAIVEVAAAEGVGMELLASELGRLAGTVRNRDLGRPRLWVDRAFAAPGAGTVVTGTQLDGGFDVGDEVTVYPVGEGRRIRGLQSHEVGVDRTRPGARVAVNLAGDGSVARGDMVGRPGHWRTSRRFVAAIRTARYCDSVEARGAYHLHIGSNAVPMSITGIDRDIAVIATKVRVPLAVGDRFIVRDTGRQLVVAGGRVLDPEPGATMRAMASARGIDPAAGPDEIADALLRARGSDTPDRLAAHSLGGTPQRGVLVEGTWLSPDRVEALADGAERLVAAHHAEYPMRAGMPLASLAEKLGVTVAVAEHLVVAGQSLDRIGPDVCLQGHRPEVDQVTQEARDRAVRRLAEGLAVPAASELGLDREELHLLVRRGDLVRLAEDMVMLPEQVEGLRSVIHGMSDGFTVAEFRDRIGLSRKYALAILEWADAEGLTVRRGDTRSVR